MGEVIKTTTKKPDAKREDSVTQSKKTESSRLGDTSVDRILFLQKTIGNQAVGRLIKSENLQTKPRIDLRKKELALEVHSKLVSDNTPKEKLLNNRPIQGNGLETANKTSLDAEINPEAKNVDSASKAVTGKKSTILNSEIEKKQKAELPGEGKKEKGAKTEIQESAPNVPKDVSINAENPGQILEQLENVPPISAIDAYNQSMQVSAGTLEKQKQQVEQSLPEIPAPTGLPPKKSLVKEKEKMDVTLKKAPSAFEGEKSGKEGEEYKLKVEVPPSISVKPTFLSGGEAEESRDTKLSESAQNELEDIQLDTSKVSTNAGERPDVDITGEADPLQLDSFQGESGANVQNAKIEASKEISKDFGENDIFPESTNETLKANKALSSPQVLSGKGVEALPIPSDAISGLNQSLGPKLKERIGEKKEEYDRGKEKYDADSANARADADKQITDLNKETSQKQIEEQNKAKADIAQSRTEWQSELDNVEQDYQEKASKAADDHRGKIATEKQKGEEKAAKHLDDAEKDAEKEKLKAEQDANEKKKEAKKESKGFWGWVKSAAAALIDGLKKAVNFIYDNLRKAVKLIFEAAKALVKAAIELARMAIVGLIKGFGLILKGLVSVVFAAFPNIAKKINSKIDSAVDSAVKAVNTAADYLKKGVEAVLDFLANTLDKLLGLIQSLYNGVLTAIGMIISGELKELMEHIGGLVSGAKEMPDHFWGQVSEELLGMNLSEPLPIERTRTPKPEEATTAAAEMGVLPSSDIDLLKRPHLSENDVTVDNVEKMELDPEFVANLKLQEGQEVEFGESTDNSRSIEAIKAEMLGISPTVQGEGSTNEEVGKTEPAKTQEKSSEEELQELMAQEPKGGCAKEKQGEPAKENEVPEYMKRGPFTAGQRARYLVHQMKIGIKQWFECNWPWLLAGAVAALIGVIALTILTGGAFLSALPPIMELVAAVMIGVAIARVTSYVGDYLSFGWARNISSAAKSLARGLAIGAIELIFALIFNLGAVIKALKSGLKGTISTAAKAAKATVTTAIKNVKLLGKLGVQAGKNVIKNGKLLMKGLKSGFAKGAKSVKDLAKKLWQQVRFKKFRIRIAKRRFILEGYINPWVLLADGTIENVNIEGRHSEVGELLDVAGKEKEGILIGIKDMPSNLVQDFKKLSKNERKKLYKELIGKNQDDIRRILLGARETSKNAKELRDSMEAAGIIFKEGDEAHHIIPSTHPRAEPARRILKKYNIKINDAPNGLPLSLDLHAGLNSYEYIDAVNALIVSAKNKSDIIKILENIGKKIRAKKFPG